MSSPYMMHDGLGCERAWLAHGKHDEALPAVPLEAGEAHGFAQLPQLQFLPPLVAPHELVLQLRIYPHPC